MDCFVWSVNYLAGIAAGRVNCLPLLQHPPQQRPRIAAATGLASEQRQATPSPTPPSHQSASTPQPADKERATDAALQTQRPTEVLRKAPPMWYQIQANRRGTYEWSQGPPPAPIPDMHIAQLRVPARRPLPHPPLRSPSPENDHPSPQPLQPESYHPHAGADAGFERIAWRGVPAVSSVPKAARPWGASVR